MAMLLPAMTKYWYLTDLFVAMAVAERPVILQALWRLIAMVTDHHWRNQI
jgi:hypothetical protein